MKRLGAVILAVLGVGLVLLGLLFLLGAAGMTRRYLVAAVSLAAGAVLAGLGIRFFRQADRITPAYLRAEILDMARRHNGEVSEADLRAGLGRRFPRAEKVIVRMRNEGLCQQRRRGVELYYVFADMLPRLTVRRCAYCGAELPLDLELSSCPNCGGSIKTGVESLSLSKEGHYSMDE